jgi:hypothetical protein
MTRAQSGHFDQKAAACFSTSLPQLFYRRSWRNPLLPRPILTWMKAFWGRVRHEPAPQSPSPLPQQVDDQQGDANQDLP